MRPQRSCRAGTWGQGSWERKSWVEQPITSMPAKIKLKPSNHKATLKISGQSKDLLWVGRWSGVFSMFSKTLSSIHSFDQYYSRGKIKRDFIRIFLQHSLYFSKDGLLYMWSKFCSFQYDWPWLRMQYENSLQTISFSSSIMMTVPAWGRGGSVLWSVVL